MLSFGFILASLLEIGLPIALGIWFTRKFGVSWKLFGVGVLTFIASQIVHIPLLTALGGPVAELKAAMNPAAFTILYAIFLGLMAGLCEETARYVGYRLLKGRAGTIGSALTVGAGHGGVESIIIGVMVLSNFIFMSLVAAGTPGLPAEIVNALKPQLPAYLGMAWYTPLAGAIERVFAISLHLALSVMVWVAFTQRSVKWYLLAVLWHAVVDAGAVYMSMSGFNMWTLEGVVALTAVVNFIFLLRYYRHRRALELANAVKGITAPTGNPA